MFQCELYEALLVTRNRSFGGFSKGGPFLESLRLIAQCGKTTMWICRVRGEVWNRMYKGVWQGPRASYVLRAVCCGAGARNRTIKKSELVFGEIEEASQR